ncbi:MAG: WecB/TagA/CpsF family glycosyltransferase [Spirochaetes bacterium]|nr:WecB/TagA/CpsF family glycosyltransferase [Spirochaetota bacterium]
MNKPKRLKLFDIYIDNLTMQETLLRIEGMIKKKLPSLVITPNVQHINILKSDEEFRKLYSDAALILPDSTPLLWAAKILGRPLKEKVSGSDLFPEFCKFSAKKGYRIFLMGSKPGVAKKASIILSRKYPGLKIIGTYSPPFGFEHNEKENLKIVNAIKKQNPDVLFVGLGSPKGEIWGWKHLDEIKVPVVIGVGAAFDFIAGVVKRAPKWIQRSGLEWLYRFLQEPTRLWKRYLLGNAKFIWTFIQEVFKQQDNNKVKIQRS